MPASRVPFLIALVAAICLAGLPNRPASEASAQGAQGRKPARKGATKKKTAGGKSGGVDLGEAQWPQFLGPDRNNISRETGLARKWPAKGPPLLASAGGFGAGFSNLALADGAVYSMGNHGARERVRAFSLESGELLWDYDNAPAYHNGYGDGPRSTPTLDGDRLYALGGTGDLVCLERDSGREVWKKSLQREFGMQVPGWGVCESVLIDGDRLICTPGGKDATMVALDKTSGATLWRSATPQGDRAAYASPIAISVGGVAQLVNFTASAVIGVRAADGQFLWRDGSSANGTANCCAPLFANDMLFSASGYGKGGAMLKLSSSGESTYAELGYHTNKMKVHHGGMVLLDDHVYGADDAVLTCLELRTGKVKWQNRSVGKGSLTCADGMLFVRSEKGPVALVQATPAAYKELGQFSPGDRSNSPAWTYPIVCGGKLFLRDQDIVQVYNLAGK